MNLRDILKQKKLAKEQAEINNIEENENDEILYPSYTSDEINSIEELKAQEAEVDSLSEGEELVDQIQDRIKANEELIEGEVEPTEAQVVQAVGEAKHFAYLTAKIDNFVTESIDFMVDGQRYALTTESFTFNAKNRKEQLKDVNMALEGIVQSIGNELKNFIKKIIEVIKGIGNAIASAFNKRFRVVNFVEKNKSQIMNMFKDENGLLNIINSMPEEQKDKFNKKMHKNITELYKNLTWCEAFHNFMFGNVKITPKSNIQEHALKFKTEKALKNVEHLMSLLIKTINDANDIFKKENLIQLENLGFTRIGLLESSIVSNVAFELMEQDFGAKDTNEEINPKNISQWYGKELDNLLTAYKAIKPSTFDNFRNGIDKLCGTINSVVSNVTNNEHAKTINELFKGAKFVSNVVKNITDCLYLEIQNCAQLYQLYTKNKDKKKQ